MGAQWDVPTFLRVAEGNSGVLGRVCRLKNLGVFEISNQSQIRSPGSCDQIDQIEDRLAALVEDRVVLGNHQVAIPGGKVSRGKTSRLV